MIFRIDYPRATLFSYLLGLVLANAVIFVVLVYPSPFALPGPFGEVAALHPALLLFCMAAAAGSLSWLIVAHVPYEIRWVDDDVIEFQCLRRTLRSQPGHPFEFEKWLWPLHLVRVPEGNLLLLPTFEDREALLERLRERADRCSGSEQLRT